MMPSLTISGVDEVLSKLADLPKQLAFATSKALNKTALEVQGMELNEVLPGAFTLRSKGAPWQKPGNKFGINVKFASKTNLQSEVGSQADWLRLQEDGGTKTIAGHRVAIPTKLWKDVKSVMIGRNKPRRVLVAKKLNGGIGIRVMGGAFIAKTKSGKEGIWVRTDEKGDHNQNRIRPIFFFFDHTKIKKRLFFFDKGAARVSKRYRDIFDYEMIQALATAK